MSVAKNDPWLCYVDDPEEGEVYVRMAYSAADIAAFRTLCICLDQKPIIRPYSSVVRQ